MKRIFGVVLVMCCFVSLVFAEEKAEINDRGEVRVVKEVAQERWRGLTEAERTAYANPGTEVPVEVSKAKAERVDFFHYVPIEKYEKVAVFSNGTMNTIEKEGERRGEQKFAWHVVLLLVSALLMVISNIAIKKSSGPAAAAFAAAAFAFAFAFAFAVAFAAFAFAAAAFAAFAVAFAADAAFVFAAADTKNRKPYIVCVVLYYVAVIVAIVI